VLAVNRCLEIVKNRQLVTGKAKKTKENLSKSQSPPSWPIVNHLVTEQQDRRFLVCLYPATDASGVVLVDLGRKNRVLKQTASNNGKVRVIVGTPAFTSLTT